MTHFARASIDGYRELAKVFMVPIGGRLHGRTFIQIGGETWENVGRGRA